ncbi:MAG: triphosphoribosyl-dephospho-CoA synthase [Gammaproteobacteria bacterium]
MLASTPLQESVFTSFTGEIDALKPGNVSRFADGHGMVYADLYRSAELVTPILCQADLSIGERLYQAVQQTLQGVGCNTNLGMLLLFLPVIKVHEGPGPAGPDRLSPALLDTVSAVQKAESALFFAAISLAKPGGLGQVAEYDVAEKPPVTLLTAMQAARRRDSIARQYTNGYRQVLDFGLSCFIDYAQRWNSVEWATVGCYLAYMAQLNDSHIGRKFGRAVAEQIRTKTAPVLQAYENYNNPEQATDLLLDYDRELKAANINPGTSADLTAVTLLLYKLQQSGE